MANGNGRASAVQRITPEIRRLERAGNEEVADALRAMATVLDDFTGDVRTDLGAVRGEVREARTSMNRVWGTLVGVLIALLVVAYTFGQATG